ncbi:hypothetical protein ACFXI8_00395 [Streptomyces niveus]|uniref:hypothetical protein n=1 Tax=Streptomyces niveus TaxID=193462 RepID=UPI0036D1E5EB
MTIIHYKDLSGNKLPLRGRMAFVLYWENQAAGRKFCPVGIDGKDMSPSQGGSRYDLVQFRFDTDAAELDEAALLNSGGLQWRVRDGEWKTPHLRKGSDYFFATEGDWAMPGIRQAVVGDEGLTFRLRMDIRNKGDMWISDDQNNGSIRMRDSENDRAALVAVRMGPDTPDDAFGTAQAFPILSREDLLKG